MSLDVIERAGQRLLAATSVREPSTHRKEAIDKSEPTYPWKQFLHRPAYQTVSGSTVPPIYPPVRRRVDFSLTTSDIDWAQPKITRFHTNRCLNPLDPQYKLASSVSAPLPVPRFIRNTLPVDDIEQAKPRRLVSEEPKAAKTSVEYAEPNYFRKYVRPLPEGGLTNSLDVHSINRGDFNVPKLRETNPLEPEYVVPLSTTTSLHHTWSEEWRAARKADQAAHALSGSKIGQVPGSKSRKLTWAKNAPLFSLETRDIDGAKSQRFVGCIPYSIYMSSEEKPVYKFHDTADIPGARAGSLRRGLVTNRITDPLNPKYHRPKTLAEKLDQGITKQ